MLEIIQIITMIAMLIGCVVWPIGIVMLVINMIEEEDNVSSNNDNKQR